ncbi:hypothetical protein [Bradyrhizobium sp. CCBAU 53380]|uniref:hypothetical protein n=1 Tax=Bradyrhizobium sp. CCBAU 53380 TaxID=1325117 RepID=UPI0023038A7B|nr:hypothetical protein [Bradyrhizobium sp. CCBAU 53380]MDA9420973.1 hypothetical protein [Bradyrhizobium sp. CCBAU 53380]
MAETIAETIESLRGKLGREPAADEIKTARHELIRRAYAGMMVTDVLLRNEAEEAASEDGSK